MQNREDDTVLLTEMAIVDTITRLILDVDTALDPQQQLLLDLLEQLDESTADFDRLQLSEFFRLLGVEEMIVLVGELQSLYDSQQGVLASSHGRRSRPFRH